MYRNIRKITKIYNIAREIKNSIILDQDKTLLCKLDLRVLEESFGREIELVSRLFGTPDPIHQNQGKFHLTNIVNIKHTNYA